MISLAFTVQANITPKAAVKLVLTNDIQLNCYWHNTQAMAILTELLDMSIDEFLAIVDCISPWEQIDSATLPQFGSLETVLRVPEILVQKGVDGFTVAQLGFYLKGDINATQGANAKFGENHGKGASFLGLACHEDGKICFSALTGAINHVTSYADRYAIAQRLCFRIPVVQTLLHNARYGKINGFAPMSYLKESTQLRRAQCIKLIFKELRTLSHPELTARINNIYWEINEGNEIEC